ncbi:MAG: DUF6174 domain-containing protein [Anaerolineales bacterium]
MKKITLLLLTLILVACSAGSSEFDQNFSKWEKANIKDYRFSLYIGCFCAFRNQMPLTVEVKNGEVISMTYSDGSIVTNTDPSFETFSSYGTIDRIFSVLKAGQSGDADEVTVTYDTAHGFPSEIYFDFIKDAVDDEVSIQVSNFELLK